MTTKEWWQLLDSNKDSICNLVNKYHPAQHKQHKHVITAQAAENACAIIRKEIDKKSLNPLLSFTKALDVRQIDTIARILNETWFGMPESTEVREEPGFFVLCDLCELPDDFDFDE